MAAIRLGRMGFLNVLPVYLALETGVIPNDFEVFAGSPAELNPRMASGLLDVSSVSSIEYARRPERYLLLPNLGIGSRGHVRSVLLLSRAPVKALAGRSILVSSQTHTSAALLRMALAEYYGLDNITYEIGQPEAHESAEPPAAVLAIGDQALSLRGRPEYTHRLDLGEVWRRWTGLPFIFGVWAARREYFEADPGRAREACRLLLASKAWGARNMDAVLDAAERSNIVAGMDRAALARYFAGLVFDLGPEELAGLREFFRRLVAHGLLEKEVELEFVEVG